MLGIDPGSYNCGFAYLERDRLRLRFRSKGSFASTRNALLHLLGSHPVDVTVALEFPESIFKGESGRELLNTREMVGVIRAECERMEIPVIRKTCTSVRSALLKKRGASDAMVSEVVRGNILGWPLRSNTHERDAAAVALVANWQLAQGRVA